MSSELTQIFRPLDAAALAEIGLLVAAAALLIAAAQRALPWIANRLHGKKRLHVPAWVPVLRLLVILAALLLIVPLIVNLSLQNMVALLDATGLALGFALKDFASSLIAGLVAMGERPYRNGDWIEVNGVYGEVRHVGMRMVQIVTPDDTVVSIPNARLWTAIRSSTPTTATRACSASPPSACTRSTTLRGRGRCCTMSR